MSLPSARSAALPSIRRRLSRLLLALSVAWGLAVSGVVWLAVSHEVDELLDDTLRASADILLGLLLVDSESLLASGRAALPDPSHDERFAWQLVGPGPRVLLRSSMAPAEPWLPQPTLGFADADANAQQRWRVYGARFGGERVLYVAQSRAERREALVEVSLSSVLAALFVGLLTAAWLRARVRRELAPLTALSSVLARYEPLEPGAALEPPQREELVPIHDAIDALGRRLASRLASERAFTAHAAHALRTPLAGIDAQLAVALRECPAELQPRLQRVRSAAGRLSRVVAALLALFRSGVELNRQPVDLAGLLQRLPVEGLVVDVVAPAWIDADPDLLAAALLNLLDNAVRYGAGRVEVTVSGQAVRLHDDGRGVDGPRRQRMQAALDRQVADSADGGAGGLGLGLMLADLVARAHGGRVVLPAAGPGFTVELWLAAPDDNQTC